MQRRTFLQGSLAAGVLHRDRPPHQPSRRGTVPDVQHLQAAGGGGRAGARRPRRRIARAPRRVLQGGRGVVLAGHGRAHGRAGHDAGGDLRGRDHPERQHRGQPVARPIGGPAGWTAFARSLGDDISRLDRRETILNEATPGDPRDTTTPAAMLRDMQAVLVGDKTGTSDNAVSNDIAIAWPPGRAPLLVTAYFVETPAGADTRNAVIAEVGRIAAAAVEQSTRPGA